jgi:hypothetical protein
MTAETEKSPRETAQKILDKCARRQIAPPEWGTPTKWVTEFDETRLANEIEKALRDRDERAAKIAAERAAFNRRLAKTHKIGDPMADLKLTRADEAEIIAGEIRGKS